MITADEALKRFGRKKDSTRVIVQGFGNVGSQAARLMHESGYKIIGVADISGGVINPSGVNIPRLLNYVERNKTLQGFDGGDAIGTRESWSQDAIFSSPQPRRASSPARTPTR